MHVYDSFFKGHIIVMINGKILLDEMVLFFKDSSNMRPTSLQSKKYLNFYIDTFYHENMYKYLGKLTLGKGRQAGYWYQYQGEITNLNVFG